MGTRKAAGESAESAKRRAGNPQLMADKTVTLTGSDRAFITRAVERVPYATRTKQETDLMKKVRG